MSRVARWRLGPGVAFLCEPVDPAVPAAVARAASRASANAASSRLSGTTATVVMPPDVTSSVPRSIAVAVLGIRRRPITPPHLAVGRRYGACQSSAMDRIRARRQMQVPALAAGPVHGPAPVGRRARAVHSRSMDASVSPPLETPRSLRVRSGAGEQIPPECRARVRRAGKAMMNLTGSQRLRTAKLRRPLPIPFGTVSQPVLWRLRHRPASGHDSALPHHPGFALSASRCTVRS